VSRTAEMFEKLPRALPRVMMHPDDFGPERMAHFHCKKCGHADWYTECTLTDYRRGIPCPNCNGCRSNG